MVAKKQYSKPHPVKKAAAKRPQKVIDKNETVDRMEPMVIAEDSRWRSEMSDLALDLTYKAAEFQSSLPEGVKAALADLVRNMNCYYSNLIEGHDTHPIQIELALNNVYDKDPKRRDLQLEARAHVAVQRWIDDGSLRGRSTAEASIREIHKRFVECLPDELRWVTRPDTGEKLPVVPGEYRRDFVEVGRLIPVSPGAIPRFMQRYEKGYSSFNRAQTIIACAAAHHRLTWIHPFLDGNGRVARLVSHAMMLDALGTGGIWSIARGLSRNVVQYKQHLAACALGRRNDLDGRGALSEETLVDFTRFFLQICIDQVEFMKNLMQPDELRARILTWAEEEVRLGSFAKPGVAIMEAVLFRGELPRADVAALIQGSDRTASRLTAQLNEFGVITSASSKAPWRLSLPATLAQRWFPGLYPASAPPR
jgi:Fic family protein